MQGINLNPGNSIFAAGNTTAAAQSATPYESQKSFASVLKDSIEKVNEAQVNSDTLTQKLANGGNVDLHQVMIASQQANITMQAALEVRNKVVEAYQEIMRMNI
ncbi:flagellar hook-basal body complex protein FliE [Bacillus sp. OV322]|uniref:flagellar hook-basal body complex protein FliE n=1 Tax=Bacillus sp. OV322 TaxID=1882764 RepID=UPI0008E5F328|nr:flagellar hook-basal body complex protein FliE [Bacillus sp. OV322]SFC07094.1 flagellar hook-basal body complex protein FliE [Bacillus sp. OV322]